MTTAVDADFVSGPELRAARLQAGVSLSGTARAYGTARQRLQEIERRAEVSPAVVKRYLAALGAAAEEELADA